MAPDGACGVAQSTARSNAEFKAERFRKGFRKGFRKKRESVVESTDGVGQTEEPTETWTFEEQLPMVLLTFLLTPFFNS